MGERQSGGGVPGRRRVHPGGTGSQHAVELEALLAAALREDAALRESRVGGEGEQRAVAAFRAARDAGAHRARTRRRDDWRPREQRRLSRSLKATLSVFVASLTVGGVAFAAIGTAGSSSEGEDKAGPHTSAPQRPSATPSAGSPSTQPDRPGTAQDTEAHCNAYEQVQGRGNALNSTAWQWLVEAAGGESKVAAYCAEKLRQAQATGKPDNSGNGEDNSADKAENATENADDGAENAEGAGEIAEDAASSGSSGTAATSGSAGNKKP